MFHRNQRTTVEAEPESRLDRESRDLRERLSKERADYDARERDRAAASVAADAARRAERDRKAAQDAEARQQLQWSWSDRRRELEAAVVELRGQGADAQTRSDLARAASDWPTAISCQSEAILRGPP